MEQRKTTVGLRILLGALLPIITLFLVASRCEVIGQATDEAAVRQTLLRSASSFAKNDIGEATKVWANDESLTIFESGHANYGWAGCFRIPIAQTVSRLLENINYKLRK